MDPISLMHNQFNWFLDEQYINILVILYLLKIPVTCPVGIWMDQSDSYLVTKWKNQRLKLKCVLKSLIK